MPFDPDELGAGSDNSIRNRPGSAASELSLIGIIDAVGKSLSAILIVTGQNLCHHSSRLQM